MSNDIKTENQQINWLKLSARINIALFILPSSIVIIMLVMSTQSLKNLLAIVLEIFILFTKPWALILILSFALSLKYLIKKKVHKISEIFIKISVYINLIINLVTIAALSMAKYM